MKYRAILADPPWPLHGGRRQIQKEVHYDVMPVKDICALRVEEFAADKAHLYCWSMLSTLEAALEVIQAWGFHYYSALTWCKRGLGMGPWRANSELLLIGVRGAEVAPGSSGLVTWRNLEFKGEAAGTWYDGPRGGHSRKPDLFHDLIESMSHGPYLELFARRQRMGWDVWGNEVDSDIQLGA